MGWLVAAIPLDNPPSIKTDEVAALEPEAREEPSTIQVPEVSPYFPYPNKSVVYKSSFQ